LKHDAEAHVFEIPDEAILAVRPTALPHVAPPDWAVRCVSVNHGVRGPRFTTPRVHVASQYPTTYTPDPPQRGKTYATNETPNYFKSMERGNLPENDYRFWKGALVTQSTGAVAVCRWCGKWVYGAKERRDHFKAKDSKKCSQKLRAVYDWARTGHYLYCFVCAKETRNMHWGFPICHRERCIREWKFGPLVHWEGLEMACKEALKRGILSGYLPNGQLDRFQGAHGY